MTVTLNRIASFERLCALRLSKGTQRWGTLMIQGEVFAG